MEKIIIFVSSSKIYEDTMEINTSLFTHQYHDFYLGKNSDNSQSFYGKYYNYSMFQNISQIEAFNLHEYYKYIHEL